MGRTTTPKYVVRVIVPGFYCTPSEWKVRGLYGCKGYGAPNNGNLKKYVDEMNASTEPGQPNAHLGANHKIVMAEIFLNNGQYEMPLATYHKGVEDARAAA